MRRSDGPISEASGSGARFLIDANVSRTVGDVFADRGHDVDYVVRAFQEGTPDDAIDVFARTEGWIILSHDRRFMKRIQQPRYNFAETVASGYGRIMLCGPYVQQQVRVEQTIELIEMHLAWARINDKRFLVSVGPNWIRYDDMPLISLSGT